MITTSQALIMSHLPNYEMWILKFELIFQLNKLYKDIMNT